MESSPSTKLHKEQKHKTASKEVLTKILNKLSTYYDSITGFRDKETIVTQLKYMKPTLRNSQGICSSKKDCLTL